jgi:hypothetical protein
MANREVEKLSVEYFNIMVGLKNKGLNPRQMDVKYVNVQDCEAIWGKRYNNNGFKYKKKITDVELFKFIKDLWPHVYQKDVNINNEINLAFVKGILAERKRWDVCWAQFIVKVQFIGFKHTREFVL